MKNLFAITLIAILAVASAMVVHEVPLDINAAANMDEEDIAAVVAASIPAAAEEEKAMWKKKKKKHYKHGKHGKHKRQGCCIKYVTITTVPVCPWPTNYLQPEIAIDSLQINAAIAPPAPLPL
ncbi:hypothetical protein BG006_000130 [Podila minutissima]|uniref:Uncharacterized protein n=1 Tax=Podila minutissima TaxID=64525 RepID=A0A9P5SQP3_9FUNG|nr:hypothetical protein BG006_000130 [Podila minutissima]